MILQANSIEGLSLYQSQEVKNMKKFLSMLLVLAMTVCLFAGCAAGGNGGSNGEESQLKVGVILIGDENEGYTYAHIAGIDAAAEALGMSADQIIYRYTITEDEKCLDTATDLVEQGCQLIISNSYGHQTYMQQAASENPDVTFVSMTGDTAAISGLSNFKNAFTSVYESRYVSGVVAGMKLKELLDNGTITDPYVGYVGAYPYAEVKSGYTAFLLGIQSIVPEAHMDVTFTNSWFSVTEEAAAAEALIARGCVIIGQHADSTGAPQACQAAQDAGKVAYSVGYNVDMLSVAPTAALTSATNVWEVYYEYAFSCMLNGEQIATDWSSGYADGAVAITELGESCAEGTAEKVAEVEQAIKDGSIHVFDTDTFTVGGEHLTSCVVDLTGDFDTDDEGDKEAIWDGYFHESELRSAPSFALDIDGVTILN